MRHFIALAFICISPTESVASLLTWDCEFDRRLDQDGIAAEAMRLIFIVDTQAGRATMTGNAGTVNVLMHTGQGIVSFMELVSSGAVQTTTVLENGEAVHSRHTAILGEFVSAQHFGRCGKL